MGSNTQPHMKELLGLCSGRFSDSEDNRAPKNTEPQDKAKEHTKEHTQNEQFNMNELLGLCSGRFSDSEDSRTAKTTETQDIAKKGQEGAAFGTQNMNELLGLCSGRFTGDEIENEGDVSQSKGKDSERSDLELGEEDDQSDDEKDDEKMEEKTGEEETSDLEEMIIKRKFGKKYEAKKRYLLIMHLLVM